jgi:hypothetical protein
MGVRDSFRGSKAAGSSSWHLTSNQYRGQEYIDLYIHSPIRLHGVVINYLSTGTTLLLLLLNGSLSADILTFQNILVTTLFLLFTSCWVYTINNKNSVVNAKILLIWVTQHVSTLKVPSSSVSSYTGLITELQRYLHTQVIKWLHSCVLRHYLVDCD